MEGGGIFQAFFALLLVVGLIGVIAGLAKRFGLDKKLTGIGTKSARLSVVDAVVIDPRRRLVLVRRDEVEHLLLLSATGETVVEQGIRTQAAPNKNESQE